MVSRWHYRVATSLADALQGADFVVISIQPGTLEVMAEEIAIAEQYGLYFPVGDTTGAPGLVRGLRSATIYAGFAEAIARHLPAGLGHQLHQPDGDLHAHADPGRAQAQGFRLLSRSVCHAAHAGQIAGEYLEVEHPASQRDPGQCPGHQSFYLGRSSHLAGTSICSKSCVSTLPDLEPSALTPRQRWKVGTTGFTATTRSNSRYSSALAFWPPRATDILWNSCRVLFAPRKFFSNGESSAPRSAGA